MKLKLNPDKTEALLIQIKNHNFFSFSVDSFQLNTSGKTIVPSDTVKSLEVLFDEYLTFEKPGLRITLALRKFKFTRLSSEDIVSSARFCKPRS